MPALMATRLMEPSKHDVYPFIDPQSGLKGAAKGKTILVTGAGSGIGRAIAQSFALAGAAKVVIAARRIEPLEATKASIAELAPGCEVQVVGDVDISDAASVKALFDSLAAPPHVLVSNAAVASEWAPVHSTAVVAWCQTIDINLTGTYRMARAYLDSLHAAGASYGRIINVSSNNAWRYIPGLSSYAISKAGVNILSEYIDREDQPAGMRVRCVAMHPGGVDTELGGEKSDEIKKLLVDQPALAGGTAVFLSTETSDFLMGRFVSATWDMERLLEFKGRILEDQDLLRQRVPGVS